MDSIEFKNNLINVRLRNGNNVRLLEVTHDRYEIHQCVVEKIHDQRLSENNRDNIKLINVQDIQFPTLVLDTHEAREQGGDYDALHCDASYMIIEA